jgi:uncharacterized PurR-regulated membrane protein YhhQ (DUF165 family)
MTVLLYVAAIVAANVITAKTTPLDLGPFLVPWGTWLIASTFFLRDAVQLARGRRVAYAAIVVALAASAASSWVLAATLAVTAGSAVAFALSETLDTEVFTRMPGRVPLRVAVSGVVGGAVDSAAFVVVALSPLWSGILPWSAVPNAILGAFVVKAGLQLVAAGAWRATRGPESLPEAAR